MNYFKNIDYDVYNCKDKCVWNELESRDIAEY